MKRKTSNSPYPVLYPNTSEYADVQGYRDVGFDIAGEPSISVTAEHNLSIKFTFDMTDATLAELVANGTAKYYVNVECGHTYYRHAFVQSEKEFAIEIPYGDVADKIELFVGLVADKDVVGFSAPGFASRFGEAKFDIEKGDILAVGTGWDVDLEGVDGCVDTLNVDCEEFSFDIALQMNAEDPRVTDFDNVVGLHSKWSALPPAIAARPNFWAWEAHKDFSDYIHNRSELQDRKYAEDDVLRYFFCRVKDGNVRRALVVHPLARLWWTGHLLRDDSRPEDPYHFVRLFTSSAFNSKILLLASSTAVNNHENAMGILDAVEQFKADRSLKDVTRDEILACTKYLNSIGAVRMVDTLGRQRLKDICYAVLCKQFPAGE